LWNTADLPKPEHCMEHHHLHHDHGALSLDTFISVIQHTLMVTFFVLVMMLLIEYITVQTKGRWSKPLSRSGYLQITVAAILGLIPGCLGAFTAVSLYIHRTFNFAALLAAMIATAGDEAFIMFSMYPAQALKIHLAIFLTALLAGYIYYFFLKDKSPLRHPEKRFPIHQEDLACASFVPGQIIPQLRKITFTRALLMTGGLIFLLHLFTTAEYHNTGGWEKPTYIIVTLIGLFIVTTVPDHFLTEHLWKHTIKKHLPKIFLWTLLAFMVIDVGLIYFHLEHWISNNLLIMLGLALLIGIIPQSGPHIVFLTLFLSGAIPFSILLANTIVQDGHGSIPLLAESGRSFVLMKAIKVALGLLAGGAGLLLGF